MQPRDRLNPREIQVATLVWQGLTNKDIAAVLVTSEQVVKNYLRTTFDKLGVWTRLELALYVASHGGATWQTPNRTGNETALPGWRRRAGDEGAPQAAAAEAKAPGVVARAAAGTGTAG